MNYLWDFFYGKKSDNKYRTRIKTLDNGSLDNYLLDPSKKPLKLFVPNIDAEDRVLVQLVQSLRLGERPDRPLQPIETFKAVLEDASNKTAPEVVVARLYNSKFFTKDEESKLGKVLADLSCSGYLTSQHPAGKDGLVCPWLKGIILPSSTLMTEYANFPIITVSEYCKHGSLQSAILDSKTLRLTMEQKLDLCIKITAAYEKLRHDFKDHATSPLNIKSTNILFRELKLPETPTDTLKCKVVVSDSFVGGAGFKAARDYAPDPPPTPTVSTASGAGQLESDPGLSYVVKCAPPELRSSSGAVDAGAADVYSLGVVCSVIMCHNTTVNKRLGRDSNPFKNAERSTSLDEELMETAALSVASESDKSETEATLRKNVRNVLKMALARQPQDREPKSILGLLKKLKACREGKEASGAPADLTYKATTAAEGEGEDTATSKDVTPVKANSSPSAAPATRAKTTDAGPSRPTTRATAPAAETPSQPAAPSRFKTKADDSARTAAADSGEESDTESSRPRVGGKVTTRSATSAATNSRK